MKPEADIDGPMLKVKINIILISILVVLFAHGCGHKDNTIGGPASVSKIYKLQGFPFDINEKKFHIFNHKIENIYQIRVSPDNNMAIYSVVQPGKQPDLFVASIDSDVIKRITSNDFIEFDPAINNVGDYAYARYENSVSESKVFVNDKQIDLQPGLYKNLALHNNTLVLHYARYYDETNWLIIYNIKSQVISQVQIHIVPDYIAFQSDKSIILQGLNDQNYKNEILFFDIETNKFSSFEKSTEQDSCFLGAHKYGERTTYVCFAKEQVQERLLFLGLRHLNQNDPTGALACSNNNLGRLSWNVSYRLEGLLSLHASGVIVDFPVESIIQDITDCLIASAQKDTEIIGWPTTKYSISGTDKLSLLVDNATILYPLLIAVNQNLVDDISKKKVISLAEDMFDWYEPDYNSETKSYHFKKGILYWGDGLWLPYNMQNIFGLALIELYKATGIEKYKLRVLELADKFRSEWVVLGDGRILWHYWPQDFYEGWSTIEGLSENTPSKAPLVDILYEDLSHSGHNVKFILETYRTFSQSPFSTSDINALANTIQGFRYDNAYSRFMSGDIDYQSQSIRFIPYYGWIEIQDNLLKEHISNGMPFSYPLFEGDIAMTYLVSYRTGMLKND